MLRIIATIHDAGMAANVGGPVVGYSEIIDIPTKCIPKKLKLFLERRKEAEQKNMRCFESVTFSLLDEPE